MIEKIDKLMAGVLKRSGSAKQITIAIMADTLVAVIQDFFGENFGQIKVKRIKDGTATITCENSVWAEEIRLNELELIQAVNDRLGGENIKKIIALS